MKPDQESVPVNRALMRMAAAVGLSPEQVNDCAERWRAAYGVDLRAPLPEEFSDLEDDALYLFCRRRILEAYKRGMQKKRTRGSR